jgi:hypothetical protein
VVYVTQRHSTTGPPRLVTHHITSIGPVAPILPMSAIWCRSNHAPPVGLVLVTRIPAFGQPPGPSAEGALTHRQAPKVPSQVRVSPSMRVPNKLRDTQA